MSTAPVASSSPRVGQSESRRFYRPELDCLRFFAFFAVFVFHTFPYEADYYSARHIPGGWLIASLSRAGSFGVDLFFLLSAYLITELLLREKEKFGQVHLRAFYVRRILRIWPLYFLAILIGAFLALVDRQQRFPAKYVAAYLLLSGNWMITFFGFPGSVMAPLWSVSFEEQFYLLWPAVVAKASRARTLFIASGILLVAAQCARLILLRYGRHAEGAVFTNTIARLDPLAFGILTAVLLGKRRLGLSRLRRLGLLLCGAILWLGAGHYFQMSRAFMVMGYPAMAVGACMIFLSVIDIDEAAAPQWLRYLGKISYGLYVFHMLCLYLVEKAIGGYARNLPKFIVFWWAGLALTVAVSALSYTFFESRFLILKERYEFVKSRPV